MTTTVALGPTPGLSARALASRRNGARSRGPKTAAGKARSSKNALKHALCAKKFVVLEEEDWAEFAALEAALLAELAPEGPLQSVLARRVVVATWRLARADRMEVEVFDERRIPTGSPGLSVIRDGNSTRSFETLLRYRNAALSELLRAQKTLQALQAAPRAETRAQAGPPDTGLTAPARAPAGKPATRRARPQVVRPIEPEKGREDNALPARRPAQGRPAEPDRECPTGPTTAPAVSPTIARKPEGRGQVLPTKAAASGHHAVAS